MIDHLSLRVRELESCKQFYSAALTPLGYASVMEFPGAMGLGVAGKPDFWLTQAEAAVATHVAFACKDRETVDAFYQAALAAGGKGHGAPGIRPDYHPNYYGAFVLDPEGNNIEAVCHKSESELRAPARPALRAAAKRPVAKPAKKQPPKKQPAKKPAKKPVGKAKPRKTTSKVRR